MKTPRLLCLVPLAFVAIHQPARAEGGSGDSPATATDTPQIIERGPDFAVFQQVTAAGDKAGGVTWTTNRFTLLENALHYLENGEWKESQDVIEPFPGGAIARRGPHQAIFSPDLNAGAVFDIQAADGSRIRGGVRAIQLTELKTGESLVLATVKRSAPGELLPPDRIVYRDAFDGLAADVVLIWRHNLFCQDVVIRERPELPEGWDAASVRLEVLTELVECPEPGLSRQWVERADAEPIEDHAVIDFGPLVMLTGHGFAVEDGWALGGLPPAPGATPVLKQYHKLPDGRRFLVESVAWPDAEQWAGLPGAGQAEAPGAAPKRWAGRPAEEREVGATAEARDADSVRSRTAPELARAWPDHREWAGERRPMALAQADYASAGYVVDFIIIPDQGTPATLVSGQTYYIRTSYYSGSLVTFQPGCVIKFKNNAYLLLYGPVSFPSSGAKPVFTSRNDDVFGERIAGVPNEPDSDGNPALHRAAQAIWIYYVNFNTTIQNVDVRWTQRAIQYDVNPGVYVTHTLQSSSLRRADVGVYANLQNATLVLNSVKKCSVVTPISCPCYPYYPCSTIYGTLTEDCEGDTDCDGLPDSWELQYFGNLSQPANGNPDGDGLTNHEEWLYGTNPTLQDSDSDGIPDGTVTVTNIKFNYDMGSSDYDAISIRQNPWTPLASEWVKDSANQPACYRANRSVRIQARITIEGSSVTSATVSATSLDADGSLGHVNATTVNFVNGVSTPEYVTFYVCGSTPNSIKKTTTDVWQWKISNVNGSGCSVKNANQSGPHTVYTVLAQPVSPVVEPSVEWGLDYACTWATGQTTANGAAQALLANGFAQHYSWDYDCHRLSSDFTRMMLSVGLAATQNTWSSKDAGVGDMCYQRTIAFDPVGWREYRAYEWYWHQWSESGGYQRDPSAAVSLLGNWGGYEDYLFSDYLARQPDWTLLWVPNQPGQSTGCEQYPQHCDHQSGELCSPWGAQICDWRGPDR